MFNPDRSRDNSTAYFHREANALAPGRIAFIVSGASASCSEFVPNSRSPYLGANLALVGGRTYGKPVGQEIYANSNCAETCTAAALSWIAQGGQVGVPIPAAAPSLGFTAKALHPRPNMAHWHVPGLF